MYRACAYLHQTAMWECVKMCHNEIIEILLEFGATLGMEGYAVSSQMCQFVREGDMVQLSRMLRAGANPNQLDYSKGSARVDFKDALGKTPYDEAVRLGNRPIMEFLKDLTDAAVSETAMLARNTDFLNACSSGNAATVTRMLKAGQDPDTANYDKRTGLMLACHGGHENIVTLLLTNGADPMKQVGVELSFVTYCNTETLKTLTGLGMEGVAVSCTMGRLLLEEDLPMLQSLIKAKADPDIEDYLGHTPLHVAASLGNLHAVRLLVEDANACVDPVDLHGRTPLDCARTRSHWQVVEYLEPLTQAAAQGVIKSRENAYGPPAVTLMGYFTRVVVPPKPAEPTHHQPLSPSRLSSQRLSPDPHGTSSLLSPFVVPKFGTTIQPSSVLRSSSKLVAFAADAQVVVSPHPSSRPPAPAAVVVGSLLNQHQGGVEAGNQAETQAPGPRVPPLQLATVRDTAQLQGAEAFPGQLSGLTEGEEGHHSTAWPPGRPYGPGLTIPDPTIPCQTQTPLRHFGSVSGAHYPEQQGVLPSPSQASWGPGGGQAQLVGGGLPSPRGVTRLASVSPNTLLSTLPHGPAPFRLASLKQAQGGLASGEPGGVEGPGAGELGELRTLPPWPSSGQLQLRGSLPGGAGAAHQHGQQRAGIYSGMGSPSLQGAGASGLGQQGGPGGAVPAGSGRTRRGSVVLLGAAGGQANVAAMRRMRRNTTAVEGQGGQDQVQTRVSGYGEVASERGAEGPAGGWPGEEQLLPWMQSVPEGESSPGQAVSGIMHGEGWAGGGAAVGVGGSPGAGPEQPSSWGPQHGPGGTEPRPESSPPPYPAPALRHSLANLLQQPSGSAPPSPHHHPPPAPTLSPHTSNPGWLAPPPGPSTSSPPRPPPAATAPSPHPTTQAPSSLDPPPAPHAAHASRAASPGPLPTLASRAASPGPLPTLASRAASPTILAPKPLVWAHNPLSRGSPEPPELDQDSLEAVVALMGRGMRVTPPGTKAPAPLPQELGKQQLSKQQQVGGVGGQQGAGWLAGGTKLAFPADRYEAEGRGVEVEGRQQEGRQQQLGQQQQQQGRGNGEVTLAPRVAGHQPQDVKTPRLGLEQGQQGGGSAASGALPVQPPAAAPPPPPEQQQQSGAPQGSLVPQQAEPEAGLAAAVGAAAGARGAFSPSPHAPSPVRASLLPGKVKVGTFPSSSPSPASSPTPSASSSFRKARQEPQPSSTPGQPSPEPHMTPDPTPMPGLGAAAAAGAAGQHPPGQAPAKDQGAASPPDTPPLHQARVPDLPAGALSAGAPPSRPPPSPFSGQQHPNPLQPAQPSLGHPSPTPAPAHPTLDPVVAMTSRTSPSQQPWPRPGSQTGGSRMVRPALQAHDPEPGLDALDEMHL
ncbi:hypothetical protein QJQ45_001277 [Haematococcus lacustris]|nr:hypothetical protein QJQ45_001277 [Haematococcus lacustris]